MSDDLSPEVTAWVAEFAAALDLDPPGSAEINEILDLAGAAARASARQAAPVACWLAARAGVSPVDAAKLIN